MRIAVRADYCTIECGPLLEAFAPIACSSGGAHHLPRRYSDTPMHKSSNSSFKPRTTAQINSSVEKKLLGYAAAAGAAGVGVLALAQPAEGKVIFTPASILVPVNGGAVYLDLNGDGINDFQFSNGYAGPLDLGNHTSALTVAPVQSANRTITAQSKNRICAAALPKGTKIGLPSPFQQGNSYLPMAVFQGGYTNHTSFGPWLHTQKAFVGFKFTIAGTTHFGWARVNVQGFSSVTITGYAYETVADKPIVTGNATGTDLAAAPPATLGRLALGAVGFVAWRREQEVVDRFNSYLSRRS
jgi:hypothetical protein